MTRARFFSIVGLLLAFGYSTTAGAVDVVVVCPEAFRTALRPWVEHRQSEGLEVATVDSSGDRETIRRRIRDASDRSTRFVLLVGDAPVLNQPGDPARQVPTNYVTSRVTAQWGSTPTLASDLAFGELTGDGIPDAAVGRLPVDTAAELSQLIERIIAYEGSDDFGAWRGQVQLTGGVGGFGALVDRAIEAVTRTVLTSVLPQETKARIAYASPGHPFYPPDGSFTEAVLRRYRQGARFWVYAGHGWVDRLDQVSQEDGVAAVLDRESVHQLQRDADGAPIALMLACYTGAFDAASDSLAEQMLLAPGGPIAVFAGSRVTMPYGNCTAAMGLIDGVYTENSARLGEAWLAALQQMNADDSAADKPASRVAVDTLAKLISPSSATLAEERREHMRLYNLIGDPTLQLHPPKRLVLEVPSGQESNVPLRVKVESPISGRLTISVDRPLGTATGDDPNQTSVASLSEPISAGRTLTPEIELPNDLRGQVIVRAQVAGEKVWATAATRTILH